MQRPQISTSPCKDSITKHSVLGSAHSALRLPLPLAIVHLATRGGALLVSTKRTATHASALTLCYTCTPLLLFAPPLFMRSDPSVSHNLERIRHSAREHVDSKMITCGGAPAPSLCTFLPPHLHTPLFFMRGHCGQSIPADTNLFLASALLRPHLSSLFDASSLVQSSWRTSHAPFQTASRREAQPGEEEQDVSPSPLPSHTSSLLPATSIGSSPSLPCLAHELHA